MGKSSCTEFLPPLELEDTVQTVTSAYVQEFNPDVNEKAGHGLIKIDSSLVPFANKFQKNTKLYKLMTTRPEDSA